MAAISVARKNAIRLWRATGRDTSALHGDARSSSALTAALRPLLPDERGILRVEQSETFLAACADHTLAYGLPDPELRLAYCASALAHGYSWFDDPLMRGLRSEFEAARSADDLHARMAGFYARFS